MATDISELISQNILNTLKHNIPNAHIEYKELSSTDIDSIVDKKVAIVKYNTKFDNNITFNVKFIFSAHTASVIHNYCHHHEDDQIAFQIDKAISSTIKKLTTDISASIKKSIDDNNMEALKGVQYSQSDVILQDGLNYQDSNNLLILNLTIDDKKIEIYLDFDDEGLQYVKGLSSQQLTCHLKDEDDVNDEDTFEEIINNDEVEEEDKNQDKKIEKEDPKKSNIPKKRKINLLIIFLSSLLIIVIIIITFILLTTKDTTNVKKIELNISKKTQEKFKYRSNMINVKQLNKRLAILTKYEILDNDLLEMYKLKEKNRLYKLKMKRLEEFSKQNKEESIFINHIDNNITNHIEKKITLIKIDAKQYKLYKDTIEEHKDTIQNISICKYKKSIDVYIKPIDKKSIINNIVKKIPKKDIQIIFITKKEFDTRCDF